VNKKRTFAFALLAATGAFAVQTGQIVLETRTDFVYETWDGVKVQDPSAVHDSAPKIDREPGLGFSASRLRTDFKGQFSNDVKYRLRIRLDKTLGTNAKINSVNSLDGAVDNAWVQPRFADYLSVRIGKFSVEGQGHEEATQSSQDVYLFSTIDKYYLAGNSVAYGVRPIINIKGFGDFNITLANTNQISSEDSLAQDRLIYGFGFSGKMGMFEPVANFHMVPKTGWNEGQMDVGAGLRTTVDRIVGTVDFQTQTTSGAGVVIAKKLDKVLSGNVLLQYKGENLRPQVKVNYDILYFGEDETSNVLGLAGGIEYYPEANAKYRYHLMVTDKRTTPIIDGKNQDVQSEIKVYAGVSCALDMWKF